MPTLAEYGIIQGTRHFFPISTMRNKLLDMHQLSKMRRLVAYAYNNSEFYREYYATHGIQAKDIPTLDFKDLPLTSKKEISENKQRVFTDKSLNFEDMYNFIYNKNAKKKLFKDKYQCFTTSGSLGTQMVVVYSAAEWNHTVTVAALNPFCPPRPGKNSRIKIAGILRTSGTSAGSLLFRTLPTQYYNAKEFSVLESVDETIKQLNEFQPEHIASYPGVFLSLLPYQKSGKLKISPKTLRFGGEILSVDNQKEIADAFQAEVYNGYGASECLIMGSKRVGDPCFNIMSQYAKVEVLNDKNEHVQPGETGKVVVTNLCNHTQPFIRYALGDIAVYQLNERGEPAIKEIVARSYKPVYFENNRGEQSYFHPFALYEMLMYVSGVNKSQILLGTNTLHARIVGSEQGITNAKQKFQNFLTENMLDQKVKFIAEAVDELRPEGNGKIPFIKYDTQPTA